MSTPHVPCTGPGSASSAIVNQIIDGRAWIAANIKNNNLRQHCRNLSRLARGTHPLLNDHLPNLRRLLRLVTERSTMLTELHPAELDVTILLLRVAAYTDHWRRLPETWWPDFSMAPKLQWIDLLQHLFQAYVLPDCFASAWLTRGPLSHLERDWYCHAAAGRSLRRAPGMPATATPRALHLMMRAPSELTIRQALRWGQARAAGCPFRLVWEIIHSAMVNDISNDRVWWRLMQKTAVARNFPARDWSLLVDGLQLIIARDGLSRATQLLDLPLADLRIHCRRLFVTLLNCTQSDGSIFKPQSLKKSSFRQELKHLALAVWPSIPRVNRVCVIHTEDSIWTFHALTNVVQLLAEAKAHRHCVASYRKKCQSGKSAIFSMRCTSRTDPNLSSQRRLTIEVDPTALRIIQVCGRWNRRASQSEREIISEWIQRNGVLHE